MKPTLFRYVYFLTFINTFTFAQAPDTAWIRHYHRGSWEAPYSVRQTSDNGFIMVGPSHLLDDPTVEIFMVKTDQNGDSMWAKVLGKNQNFYANSVKEDPSGCYVIAGEKQNSSTADNAFLLKTNENGDSLWTHFYGGNRGTLANDVTCSLDSGYVIAGWQFMSGSRYNVFIHKLDANGDSVWLKIINRGGDETGNCITQTTDGGYIIGGETDYHTHGRTDFYLIKTDSLGDTLWTRIYGRSDDDRCLSVQQTSDGGYILCGSSDTTGYTSSLAVKTDSNGTVMWQKVFDRGTGGDFIRSVQQTSDGGYIFGGSSINPYRQQDFCFVRTDDQGNTLWIKTIDGPNSERAFCVLQTSDLGYILVGEYSYPAPRSWDFRMVKLNAFPSGIEEPVPLTNDFRLLQNYPNPFNPVTTIIWQLAVGSKVELKIFNILGEEIATLINGNYPAGRHQISWNPPDIPSGVYFYRITAGDYQATSKMLLIR